VLILTAKHVSKEELSFLKNNHVYQLIQKGDINREGLLRAIAGMVGPGNQSTDSAAPSSTRRPRPRAARPSNPLVLIVEDNPDSRRAMSAVLADKFRLIEATDGQSGVEQARAHRPDLILMDIAMPVMDGIQALHEIRADADLEHIPVIAVTASAMKGDQETILAYGFDAYLSKPIDEERLFRALNEALD
jgi:CheY-like chemotaxis protein